ncbi:MAG TPA: GNAT family N-acetyltransferase, partial [Spongiibacteraceae bacterium]|nr:GNAT family N-acetyltransferase [Spongiibacteraceae bacterium]
QTIWITTLDANTSLDSITKQLSRNWRWKLRRSFKEYEKDEALHIDAAHSIDEALEYFQQMGILHTQRWQRVGIAGSFAHENWVNFHRDLIQRAFDRGEIQLLRVACGPRAIGYIYNFLWRGSVHMLQSGFVSEQSNVLRPGYVSHILAMQFNAQRGATQYDFMTGDAEYKRILATAYPPLISARLQKSRPKFVIENLLVAIYRKFRQHSSQLSLRQIKSAAQQGTGGLAIATNLESIYYFLNLTSDLI